MKFLIIFLLLLVTIFPKLNIINISGIRTGIRIEDFAFAIILSLLILFHKRYSFKNDNLKKITILFLIYLIFCLVSTVIGTNLGYVSFFKSFLFVIRKLEYFLFIYLGYIFYKKDSSTLKKIINFVVIFHLIFCIFQYFGFIGSFHGGQYLNSLHQGRITSTFNGSYELSAFLIIASCYYLYELIFNHKNIIINLFILSAIFICIYVSKSRTSLICFIIIMIFMFIKKHSKNIFSYLINIIILSLICASLILIVDKLNILENSRFSMVTIDGYIESMECAWKNKNFDSYLKTGTWFGSSECFNVGTDDSFNLRFNHWAQLLDGFKKYPILGLGASITTTAADGNYIRILVESGIVGFILWSILILYLIIILDKKNIYDGMTKYALFSLLLGAIFIDLFEASKIMMTFWFMLGVTLKYDEQN